MKSVSIIIPIYNGEQFVKQCFDNICKQTYEHSAIECIFVNDGSEDNSGAVIEQFIRSDKSGILFRLISHEHNQGVSAARNTGIKEASSDYLFFMDSDDNISPECIEILIRATFKYPKATIIVGNLLNKKGNSLHHSRCETICQNDSKRNLHDILLFIYAGFPVNKLISRQFILKNQLYFPVGIPYFEDLHWNIDVARLSQEIVYLPEITYYYEFVSSSAMSVSHQKQNILAECYISLINKAMTLNDPACIIETHLFICFYLMKLLNMRHSENVCKTISMIRKNLFRQSIKLGKPILLLYDLQLYQPFRHIANCKFVRNRSAELRLWVCDKTK